MGLQPGDVQYPYVPPFDSVSEEVTEVEPVEPPAEEAPPS